MQDLVEERISAHSSGEVTHDLFGALIRSMDSEDGLNRREVLGNVFTFLCVRLPDGHMPSLKDTDCTALQVWAPWFFMLVPKLISVHRTRSVSQLTIRLHVAHASILETTANTLAFLMAYLALFPEQQDLLYDREL